MQNKKYSIARLQQNYGIKDALNESTAAYFSGLNKHIRNSGSPVELFSSFDSFSILIVALHIYENKHATISIRTFYWLQNVSLYFRSSQTFERWTQSKVKGINLSQDVWINNDYTGQQILLFHGFLANFNFLIIIIIIFWLFIGI